mgnify:CR=1 FL=1
MFRRTGARFQLGYWTWVHFFFGKFIFDVKAVLNRSENITNRKICFFCIETVNKKFFQLRKKIFCFDAKKIPRQFWDFLCFCKDLQCKYNANCIVNPYKKLQKHKKSQNFRGLFFRPDFFLELIFFCLQFRCRKSCSFDFWHFQRRLVGSC